MASDAAFRSCCKLLLVLGPACAARTVGSDFAVHKPTVLLQTSQRIRRSSAKKPEDVLQHLLDSLGYEGVAQGATAAVPADPAAGSLEVTASTAERDASETLSSGHGSESAADGIEKAAAAHAVASNGTNQSMMAGVSNESSGEAGTTAQKKIGKTIKSMGSHSGAGAVRHNGGGDGNSSEPCSHSATVTRSASRMDDERNITRSSSTSSTTQSKPNSSSANRSDVAETIDADMNSDNYSVATNHSDSSVGTSNSSNTSFMPSAGGAGGNSSSADSAVATVTDTSPTISSGDNDSVAKNASGYDAGWSWWRWAR